MSEVSSSHEVIHIHGRKNDAILISEEDWRSIQETMYLNSIPGMADSINKAIAEPLEECVKYDDIEW